jgi:ATP:ADP antiporter, AAA family
MFLSKIIKKIIPVERFELKKLIPLFFMKFFISFNYGILTCMKDTFVVTAKGSGAEVIPVLKGWIVLPIALLITLLYSKLSNHFKRESIFYGTIIAFLCFIGLFAFVLFPNRELLSPHQSADALTNLIGTKYQHWISIYRNWMQAIFFVVAELWGSVVIFLMFWGFVNQINKVHEAKRFYMLFIVGGDLATIATGPLIWHYASKYAHLDFSTTLQSLASYVIAFGFLIMLLHWWVVKYVLTDQKLFSNDPNTLKQQGKTKLSLKEGLKFIASSKYLRCIAIMVVAYGLTINLIEVTWKAHLKELYPSTADYQAFMGKITSSVGIASFLTSLFLGGGILRLFGWRFSALITPIVVGSTGLLFLFFVLLKTSLPPIFGFSPLFLIVILGAIQNVSSKVMKYSFFDPTKEMAFIPLDQESKVKGKAAIDIIGSRLGKSGSAWIQIILIEIAGTGSVLSITYFLVPIIIISVFRWMVSVRSLNTQFIKQKNESEELEQSSISQTKVS